MKMWWMALIGVIVICTQVSAQDAVLLSAYATSSSKNSTTMTCLLDPACQGLWTPNSKDSGVDEGLYFQFDQPTTVDFVVVEFSKPEDIANLAPRIYINGKTTSPEQIVYWYQKLSDKSLLLGGRRDYAALRPMNVQLQSLFFKLNTGWSASTQKPTIKSIRFYRSDKDFAEGAVFPEQNPLTLRLPKVAAATISASSILEPEQAYHPYQLFDSKTDSAWATNGLKTSGVGESVTILFQDKQTISGLVLWNGYERSSTHYTANARPRKLALSGENAQEQIVSVPDRRGKQTLKMASPIETNKLSITIKEITAGTKYKDVLISELRFIDSDGRIILPVVSPQEVTVPAAMQPFFDRSWASFVHPIESECYGPCFNKRIRIRSNGTFVIYKDFDFGSNDAGSDTTAQVLEGNWEPKADGIRIFGKKYTTAIRTSEYLNETTVPVPAIFQSNLTFRRYKDLNVAEKKRALNYLISSKSKSTKNLAWRLFLRGDSVKDAEIRGATSDELSKALEEKLEKLDAVYIESSVVSDLLMPTDSVEECYTGC